MVNHKLGVHFKFKPVLAFHRLHQAVGHSVRQNDLQVLAFVVVLKVVVVLVGRHQTVVHFRSNVKEKRKVQFVIVDLRVSCQSPVYVEVPSLAKLVYLSLIHI